MVAAVELRAAAAALADSAGVERECNRFLEPQCDPEAPCLLEVFGRQRAIDSCAGLLDGVVDRRWHRPLVPKVASLDGRQQNRAPDRVDHGQGRSRGAQHEPLEMHDTNLRRVPEGFDEEPVAICPKCEGKSHRVIHSVPVIFKGGGFYITDSRKGGNPGSGEGKKEGSISGEKPKGT